MIFLRYYLIFFFTVPLSAAFFAGRLAFLILSHKSQAGKNSNNSQSYATLEYVFSSLLSGTCFLPGFE